MKVGKGLEFPVVALAGVGHMQAEGEDEQEAAWVFFVAATWATQRLVIGVGWGGGRGVYGMTFIVSRYQFETSSPMRSQRIQAAASLTVTMR